jgi:3-ketosteroid 9alpha-monooxygenase subunit B
MARDHGFHSVRITRIVRETADTRTFVLAVPPSSRSLFGYRAGQFLTFRVCGTLRSYSMSSSPDTDDELMTTVKRVPGGLVSNWMHDHLAPGDAVEVTRPAGVFCLRDSPAPLVALGAGSGITPILSLVKSALATTARRVRVLTAHRDASAVIFGEALDGLAGRYPGRLEVVGHLDIDGGLVTENQIRGFAGGDTGADFYLCGPAPFMDLAQRALVAHGAGPGQIFTERFEPAAGEPPRRGRARSASCCPAGRIPCRSVPARPCWRARAGPAWLPRSPARRATVPPAWPRSPRARPRCGSTTRSTRTRSPAAWSSPARASR